MDKEQLDLLEEFVDLCRIKPSVLEMDDLKFFKDWLIELGATLPKEKPTRHDSGTHSDKPEPMEQDGESEESDIEISSDGVIVTDEVVHEQVICDMTIEVTEEMADLSDEKRNEALSQFREGHFVEALTSFTEAIKLNPTCAMLYAKRASCYVKMNCPNAAIKDCKQCFELNPDSALAYKWRGMSLKMLGKWEEAFSDLTQSLKLDYADDTYKCMKEVESKAKMIREHKRKYERKREDKRLGERREKVRRAQEANEKAKQSGKTHHGFGDKGDKCKGTGGMPGGLGDLLSDPELVEDLKDPEVMAALSEIMANPASLLKHQGNPKISKIVNKMQSKFASGGQSCPMDTGDTDCGPAPHRSAKTNVADDLD